MRAILEDLVVNEKLDKISYNGYEFIIYIYVICQTRAQ